MNLLGSLCVLVVLIQSAFGLQGGTNAAPNQFPAQVAIDFPNNTFCAGTIFNQNHVITAAGCALDNQRHLVQANQVFIRASSNVLATQANRIQAAAVFVHPEYSPFTRENDIAVIRITGNFAFNAEILNNPTAAAEIEERIVPDGTVCQVPGWNPTPAIAQPPLQFLNVPILNRDTVCNLPINHNGEVLESMLCAGNVVPNQGGVCPTTRGGGLYCNGRFTGVLSSGFGCGTANNPGVYVQVRFYDNWLNTQTARTHIPNAGPTPKPGINVGSGSSEIKFSFLLMTVAVAVVAAPRY